MYSLILALVIAACTNPANLNAPKRVSNATERGVIQDLVSDTPLSSRMSLRIIRRTGHDLFLSLRNDSDRRIFVSYVPPKDDNVTTFLAYSLEMRTSVDNDFKEYGEGFHHVPNLHPINAHTAVTFRLLEYPNEKGEYRVRVGYYADETIYRIISERLAEMTDAERRRADEARGYVFSDSFLVPLKARR